MAKAKRTAAKKTVSHIVRTEGKPDSVTIRMYCIGTGDCFVLKFFRADGSPFTMLIDCGSCQGDKQSFTPYIEDLAGYVDGVIDLLVVTHEHQDHVNGFQKCSDIFASMQIRKAWFAWTEDPKDPGGEAAELQKKRRAMKAALSSAIHQIREREPAIREVIENSPFAIELRAAHEALVNGLHSFANINLDEESDTSGKSLAGMRKIKEILQQKGTIVRYLDPGTTLELEELPDIRFHVLGPPRSRNLIFKEGKEGSDVYNKSLALGQSDIASKAFMRSIIHGKKMDLPFAPQYIADREDSDSDEQVRKYNNTDDDWRKIDNEWLMSAGTLALRLTSHINNTSLVLAIESEKSKKVMLMPGDAEYGSWESWHLIKAWDKKGKDGKHFVEDLLNRTVFYKVGHHLSYNGTALEKGILMMPESNMIAMATLDRERIHNGWKTTMPNSRLLAELTRRTGGRFFIMNEFDIKDAPSLTLDPATLDKAVYEMRKKEDGLGILYKQYTLQF